MHNMTNLDDGKLVLTPVIQEKGTIYLDPPECTDASDTRIHLPDIMTIMTDLNKMAQPGRVLHELGKAIYKFKTNLVKENVYLTNLPKGYYIALERRQRQYCIVGHPGGHRYSNAESFLPHLMWLEQCLQQNDPPSRSRSYCPCKLCQSSDRHPTLQFEINHSAMNTFKILEKVEIRLPAKEFYPTQFIIPLPSIIEPDVSTLLSSNGDD